MIDRGKTHTITISEEDDGGLPAKVQYRADIYIDRIEDHHAIGATPQQALFELAQYWLSIKKPNKEG
jgi:hypothetical protein